MKEIKDLGDIFMGRLFFTWRADTSIQKRWDRIRDVLEKILSSLYQQGIQVYPEQ